MQWPDPVVTPDLHLQRAALGVFDQCTKLTVPAQDDQTMRGIFIVRQTSKRKTVHDQVIHLIYPLGTSIASLRRLLAKHWKIGVNRITIQQQRHHQHDEGEGDEIPLVTLADQLIIDDLRLVRLLVDWQQQPMGKTRKRKLQAEDSEQQAAAPKRQLVARTDEEVHHCTIDPKLSDSEHKWTEPPPPAPPALQHSHQRRINELAGEIVTRDQAFFLAKHERLTLSIIRAKTNRQALEALAAALRKLRLTREADLVTSSLQQQPVRTSFHSPARRPIGSPPLNNPQQTNMQGPRSMQSELNQSGQPPPDCFRDYCHTHQPVAPPVDSASSHQHMEEAIAIASYYDQQFRQFASTEQATRATETEAANGTNTWLAQQPEPTTQLQ
eukprot:2402040-Amphidinium_carterae.4